VQWLQMLLLALQGVVYAYILLIVVWAFGSWNPQWRYQGWYRTIGGIVEPYIEMYRVMRLNFGQFDLTPMVAICVLSIISIVLRTLSENL
jgi:uncharacterized protein YggT (Ycf19 family)